MNISKDELRRAAAAAGIGPDQADSVWEALRASPSASGGPKFETANVAYYLGAMVVIGAMGWLMNKAWEQLGGGGLLLVSACYAVSFVLGGRTLWNQGLRIPGGLLFTMAVCMTPLAVYGIERWTGYWPAKDPGAYRDFHPYINASWIYMEIATVVAGLAAIRLWRFPFLMAPVAYALWFMSMDLTELWASHEHYGWMEREWATMVFGAAMLFAFYIAELKGLPEDFCFWGYLFGLMAFWGGLTSMDSDSEVGKLIYCLINIGLIFCALVLRRRTFIVFGAVGFFIYLGHLAYTVFKDSILFPFALTLLGIGIIYLGLQYQRRGRRIGARIRARLLPVMGGLIPPRALADYV